MNFRQKKILEILRCQAVFVNRQIELTLNFNIKCFFLLNVCLTCWVSSCSFNILILLYHLICFPVHLYLAHETHILFCALVFYTVLCFSILWFKHFFLFSGWQDCLPDGSQLCWAAESSVLSTSKSWQWICDKRPNRAAGIYSLILKWEFTWF